MLLSTPVPCVQVRGPSLLPSHSHGPVMSHIQRTQQTKKLEGGAPLKKVKKKDNQVLCSRDGDA